VLAGEIGERSIEAVVGKPAAHLVEEIVALFERVHQVVEGCDADIGDGFQLGQPGVEALGQVHVERLIGAEGGIDLGGHSVGRHLAVVREIVGRIVGGADAAFTWNFRMMPCGRRSSLPSSALAWSQMRSPLDSSSSSSMPK
jgi:hypothetical protein